MTVAVMLAPYRLAAFPVPGGPRWVSFDADGALALVHDEHEGARFECLSEAVTVAGLATAAERAAWPGGLFLVRLASPGRIASISRLHTPRAHA